MNKFIISIVGLILSLFLIMALCTRSGVTADRGTRMGPFTGPGTVASRTFTKRSSITPQNLTANFDTVNAVNDGKADINKKRSGSGFSIINRRNSKSDATSNTSSTSNTSNTVNKDSSLMSSFLRFPFREI